MCFSYKALLHSLLPSFFFKLHVPSLFPVMSLPHHHAPFSLLCKESCSLKCPFLIICTNQFALQRILFPVMSLPHHMRHSVCFAKNPVAFLPSTDVYGCSGYAYIAAVCSITLSHRCCCARRFSFLYCAIHYYFLLSLYKALNLEQQEQVSSLTCFMRRAGKNRIYIHRICAYIWWFSC